MSWYFHNHFIFSYVLSCHSTQIAILALAKHNWVLYLRVLYSVFLAEGEELGKPVSSGLICSL